MDTCPRTDAQTRARTHTRTHTHTRRYLNAMAAPYAHLGVEYFPLGGINTSNMDNYLVRPDVITVGGSWIVSADLVKRRDWEGMLRSVTRLCPN